jgi:hypothetical protein
MLPPGGGYTPPPGAPRDGETFRASRDLAARRDAYYGARPGGGGGKAPIGLPDDPSRGLQPGEGERRLGAVPPRPIVPGERRYRDGDRVRHSAFGQGTVVTSRLTRDDEEVTVAFPDRGVKKLMASFANLELLG